MDVTRFTAVAFTPDPNTSNNGFFTPQLNQTEINNIPANADQVGGILFNESTEELQYLAPTLQWVNVATDHGEPTFSELSVTTDITVGGNIYGARLGASIFTIIAAPTDLSNSNFVKLNGTTGFHFQNGFRAVGVSYNSIQYHPPSGAPSTVNTIVRANANMTTIGATTSYQLALVKNGSLSTSSDYFCQLNGVAGAQINLPICTNVVFNANDYVELWMGVLTGSSTGNYVSFSMSVLAI